MPAIREPRYLLRTSVCAWIDEYAPSMGAELTRAYAATHGSTPTAADTIPDTLE